MNFTKHRTWKYLIVIIEAMKDASESFHVSYSGSLSRQADLSFIRSALLKPVQLIDCEPLKGQLSLPTTVPCASKRFGS
jgi:hypothetical protein